MGWIFISPIILQRPVDFERFWIRRRSYCIIAYAVTHSLTHSSGDRLWLLILYLFMSLGRVMALSMLYFRSDILVCAHVTVLSSVIRASAWVHARVTASISWAWLSSLSVSSTDGLNSCSPSQVMNQCRMPTTLCMWPRETWPGDLPWLAQSSSDYKGCLRAPKA